MKDDPLITRVREARHKISEKFSHQPRGLVEHYIKLQKSHRNRLVKSDSGKKR